MSAAAYWWNAVGLFLIVFWALQRAVPGPRGLFFAFLGASAVCAFPFHGHPLRFWLSGLTPNMSLPLISMLLASIVQRGGGRSFFGRREWRAAFYFGAVAALCLYPSALGLGPRNFDAYSLGWPWQDWSRSVFFFGPVALIAAFLVWRGNRFGWVLALAAVAYVLRLQESRNFWDYLIDPLYAVASLLICLFLVVRRLMRR